MAAFSLVLLLINALLVVAQDSSAPSSFPHAYPNQPEGDLSPEWQDYFRVTESLPNVTFNVGQSYAGNIPVERESHPNDTLFFWAFEHEEGSLTGDDDSAPWAIWLNGGPGSSSMYGLLFENGPIRVAPDYSLVENAYSWDRLADYIWVDQPVGVGYSTADSDGYVASEDQMGDDFMGFLGNLVKVFPSLATRPLHLTGESYAGVYIPYILKSYFSMSNPPVRIEKIVIGDGSITSGQTFLLLPALSVIETFPQIINYDIEVYNYFKEQSHLCGYDVNLTYPQDGPIPAVQLQLPTVREVPWMLQAESRSVLKELQRRHVERVKREPDTENSLLKRDEQHRAWKTRRDLTGRANGTLDPWYACALQDEFVDYALNFTYPWNITGNMGTFSSSFDLYDVTVALWPEVNKDASLFMNDDRTRAALHAPTSKDWTLSFPWVFGGLQGDPSPEPMVFLSEMATNATAQDISVILYSANNDALIAHLSTEITIQNTTFGGIQGFTEKPSTPWYDDDGNFAGVVHQERGWTYVLFTDAGHMVPTDKPEAAHVFLREFVLGSNTTGLVQDDGFVVGGQDPNLVGIIPGQDEIYYGAAAIEGTHVFPSPTIEAWREFMATASPKTLVVDNGALRSGPSVAGFAWGGLLAVLLRMITML